MTNNTVALVGTVNFVGGYFYKLSTETMESVPHVLNEETNKSVVCFSQLKDTLTLKRTPDNKYDSNAIAVLFNGEQIGHLKREDAAKLAPLMDEKYDVVISSVLPDRGEDARHFTSTLTNQKSFPHMILDIQLVEREKLWDILSAVVEGKK